MWRQGGGGCRTERRLQRLEERPAGELARGGAEAVHHEQPLRHVEAFGEHVADGGAGGRVWRGGEHGG